MKTEKIVNLECKKHIKIYKLNREGLKNKEIASLLGTNYGHVYNVLKKYSTDENLRIKSDLITVE